MRSFTHCWWRFRLNAALLFGALVSVGQAASAATTARAASERTECLGYYTVNLLGEFEYALTENFDGRFSSFGDRLGAWGTEIRLDLMGVQAQEVSISPPAGAGELTRLMESRNQERQREIDEVSGRRSRLDPSEVEALKVLTKKLAELHLYEPIPGRDAISRIEREKLAIHSLVNGHILSTTLPLQGPPERTLDSFLSHYKPRALGEVPSGPGVCIPYGFFTDEKQPATIGLNIRLKDQPDIVVYLRASDAATDAPDDPGKLFDGLTPISTFFGSRQVTPLHKIKPLQAISIDGVEGLGSFVRVLRKAVADQSRGFNNAAEGNEDWGYFAYIPGKPGGKPGESYNLMFRVERFGRFAKAPMTEKEFRELTLRIAASIKRRPGASAW